MFFFYWKLINNKTNKRILQFYIYFIIFITFILYLILVYISIKNKNNSIKLKEITYKTLKIFHYIIKIYIYTSSTTRKFLNMSLKLPCVTYVINDLKHDKLYSSMIRAKIHVHVRSDTSPDNAHIYFVVRCTYIFLKSLNNNNNNICRNKIKL